MSKIEKKHKINIEVGIGRENLPENIRWKADDDPSGKKVHEAKAMLLAFFDRDSLDSVKLDIWTKDMQVVEMDRFFFQTLRAMADTYYKATQNTELAAAMQQFVHFFGEKTEIIPKDK